MEICVSKLYGPPKKKSIQAIRKFPANCGMKAPQTIIQQLNGVIHLDPPSGTSCLEKSEGYNEDAALQEGKASNASDMSAEKSSAEVDTIQETRHCTDEQKASAQLDLHRLFENTEVPCASKLYGPPKRRKLPALRRYPPGCGPLAILKENQHLGTPGCEANDLIKCKEPMVGKNPVVADSSQTEATLKANGLDARVESNQDDNDIEASTTHINDGNISGKSAKKGISNEIMSLTETAKKGSQTREESLYKGHMLNNTMSMIETERKGSPTADQSSFKANPYKKSLKQHMPSTGEYEQNKKIVMQDSNGFPEKVKRKRMGSSPGKASLQLGDERSQLQLSDEKGRSTTHSRIPTKAVVAEKDPRSHFGKSLPLKPGKSVNIQEVESTEVIQNNKSESTPVNMCDNVRPKSCQDKIIVLALMAPSNCPWRRGKGSVRSCVQQSSRTLVKRRKIDSSI